MFQAGDVAPSSDFLLQLLTPGDNGVPLFFVGLHLPLFESPVFRGVKAEGAPTAGLYVEDPLLAFELPLPLVP